jgi:hypothetical protein
METLFYFQYQKIAIRKEYWKKEQNNGNPVLFSISKDSYKEGILKKERKLMETLFFSISKENCIFVNPRFQIL